MKTKTSHDKHTHNQNGPSESVFEVANTHSTAIKATVSQT